eukprot:gene58236-biopygen121004
MAWDGRPLLRSLRGAEAAREAARLEGVYAGRLTQIDCNQLINAYAKGGAQESAWRLFDAMPGWSVRRDKFTFGAAVKACGRDWGRAEQLLGQMREELGGCSVEACNAAINCCAEGGAAEAARRLFDAMPGWGVRRNVRTFGAAVKAVRGDARKAAELLAMMQRELGCAWVRMPAHIPSIWGIWESSPLSTKSAHAGTGAGGRLVALADAADAAAGPPGGELRQCSESVPRRDASVQPAPPCGVTRHPKQAN